MSGTVSRSTVETLEQIAGKVGLVLDEPRLHQLGLYLDRLLLWNRRLALVSQNGAQEIVCKHFADSLYAAGLCRENEQVIDLGSGAGFPGLVIAIACPRSTVVLVESKRKKVSFLTDVISSAGLTNVQATEGRIEEQSADPRHAQKFTVAISRALTSTQEFLALAHPFLREQGRAVTMKGPLYQQELDALNLDEAGFALSDVLAYRLPDGSQRALVIFERA